MGFGKLCDIGCMRNIRRAFKRKQFHLWMPETAVARSKRRKRFLRLWKELVRPSDGYPDKVGYGDI
jgi:hypothetical protein